MSNILWGIKKKNSLTFYYAWTLSQSFLFPDTSNAFGYLPAKNKTNKRRRNMLFILTVISFHLETPNMDARKRIKPNMFITLTYNVHFKDFFKNFWSFVLWELEGLNAVIVRSNLPEQWMQTIEKQFFLIALKYFGLKKTLQYFIFVGKCYRNQLAFQKD